MLDDGDAQMATAEPTDGSLHDKGFSRAAASRDLNDEGTDPHDQTRATPGRFKPLAPALRGSEGDRSGPAPTGPSILDVPVRGGRTDHRRTRSRAAGRAAGRSCRDGRLRREVRVSSGPPAISTSPRPGRDPERGPTAGARRGDRHRDRRDPARTGRRGRTQGAGMGRRRGDPRAPKDPTWRGHPSARGRRTTGIYPPGPWGSGSAVPRGAPHHARDPAGPGPYREGGRPADRRRARSGGCAGTGARRGFPLPLDRLAAPEDEGTAAAAGPGRRTSAGPRPSLGREIGRPRRHHRWDLRGGTGPYQTNRGLGRSARLRRGAGQRAEARWLRTPRAGPDRDASRAGRRGRHHVARTRRSGARPAAGSRSAPDGTSPPWPETSESPSDGCRLSSPDAGRSRRAGSVGPASVLPASRRRRLRDRPPRGDVGPRGPYRSAIPSRKGMNPRESTAPYEGPKAPPYSGLRTARRAGPVWVISGPYLGLPRVWTRPEACAPMRTRGRLFCYELTVQGPGRSGNSRCRNMCK